MPVLVGLLVSNVQPSLGVTWKASEASKYAPPIALQLSIKQPGGAMILPDLQEITPLLTDGQPVRSSDPTSMVSPFKSRGAAIAK
jgi:hypothetical protein